MKIKIMKKIIKYVDFINEGKFSLNLIYKRSGSKYDGQHGVFIREREDGKYIIRFNNGSTLAASPENLFTADDLPTTIKQTKMETIKEEPVKTKLDQIDPYGEENWDPDDLKKMGISKEEFEKRQKSRMNKKGDCEKSMDVRKKLIDKLEKSRGVYKYFGNIDDYYGERDEPENW